MRANLLLLLLCMAEFMIVLDFSITNVALPTIQRELSFSDGSLQWVVSAYALGFGGFLLLGGRISDLFGRRRLFIIGLVAFSLVSLLAGFAQDATQLIILRGLQGLAASLVAPAALSLLTTSFPEGKERNRALGAYGAVLSFGFVAGVILGGVLTDGLSWEWVFFVNVPIGLATAVFAPVLVPRPAAAAGPRPRLDVPGAITITGAAVSIVYGFSIANTEGWLSVSTLGSFALGLVLLALFVLAERRSAEPLVPLEIFKVRSIVGANVVNVLLIGAFVGITYVLTLYLQRIKDYSPLETGLSFAVLGLTAMVAGFSGAKLAGKLGLTRAMLLGVLLQAVGAFVVATLPAENSLAYILVGTALVGFGNVAAVVMISITATAGVADHQQGLAGGLLNTSQQLGAAIGAAAFAAIAASRTASLLPEGTTGSVSDPVALLSGFRYSLVCTAIAAVIAAVIGAVMLRTRADSPS
ncbi:MFS transporter [Micromonospora sp. WMMD734]|uniref:MFS transporter n=1 Tax=Micromonospora humidisoli TaxID=2807622 RepID=A0ABS2J448_9ACTN|nr:MFS transporter [Micromonospora humidisoli]MBM7081335.1 MFS transporter [Micromonospora humidisoli]